MEAFQAIQSTDIEVMLQSLAHTYRGFLIEVGVGCKERDGHTCFVGGYMISDRAGNMAGYGKTTLTATHSIADRIALSMALDVVDKKLRMRFC